MSALPLQSLIGEKDTARKSCLKQNNQKKFQSVYISLLGELRKNRKNHEIITFLRFKTFFFLKEKKHFNVL